MEQGENTPISPEIGPLPGGIPGTLAASLPGHEWFPPGKPWPDVINTPVGLSYSEP